MLVQAAATRGATTETFHVPFTDVAPLVAAYDDGQPDLPSPTATETPKPADDSYDDGAHTLSLLATGGAETASSSTSSPTQPEDSPQQLASARQAMEHVLRTSQGRHWLRQCAELQTHPAVAQLRSLLHLDAALGYFTMQRQAPNGSWLVVDISWGMPLFDEHLNAALCLCAEKCAVFSVDNRAALVAAQRRLTLRLLDFIVMHGVSRKAGVGGDGCMGVGASVSQCLNLLFPSVRVWRANCRA